MECFWCMTEYKANAEVLGDFCSPELNTELSQKMNSNLAGCLDCVMAYHYARQYFLKRNESSQKELFTWEVNRLCEHMRNSLHPNREFKLDEDLFDWQEDKTFSGDDLLERLSISLQEILNYPYLLWSKDVANLTTEALLRLEREGSPLVLHDKLPGVYLLIIHPNSQVRKWAKKSLQFLGSISCDDYHDLRDVVKWIINVSEFDLLRSRNLEDIDVNILPAHLFLRNHIKEYWASVCTLLKKFESKTIRLQLLSRDNHNQFVTMLLTAIDQENCQNNGRDSEFWPLLNCLLILLKRLESRIWQHINIGNHADLFCLVALHPAYLNEVKRLPGYNGKDVQITYECTASSGQGLAYREDQTQRLSDKLGTKSAESLRILMFSWFKLFLESVVAFGDTAKEVVKIVFKYFNSLRDELEIPSEGYDNAMAAMIRCLEFLLKNSLQSFLNFAAKYWIPGLVEILKLDIVEPSLCQREAISFCKLFLKNRQEIHEDVSSLIAWIEDKSEKNVKNDSRNLGRLEELLFSHFRDFPPITRHFDQDKRTILLPSKKSRRKLRDSSSLTSPLLDGKVCLKKLNVGKTSVSSSSSTKGKNDDSYSCLKPVKPIKKSVPLKGSLKIEKIGIEKFVKTKQEPIVISDSSDDDSLNDDEPLGHRYLRKRAGGEEESPAEYKRKCVQSEKMFALDTDNKRMGTMNTSFVNIDNVTSIPDYVDHGGHLKSVGLGNQFDTVETDLIASNNDDVGNSDVDFDDTTDHNSSESRKRKIKSRTVSDEEACVSSGDELMTTHVFSPGVRWQNEHEVDDSQREETLATVISRIKSEVKDFQDVGTLVAVKPEVEDSQYEETIANARSRVKHEVEDVPNEKILSTVRSGVKYEVMDFQDEETLVTVRSRVKHEMEDVPNEETFSIGRSRVKHEVMDFQGEETLANGRSRVKHEVEVVPKEETLSTGRSGDERDRLQDKETIATGGSQVKHEVDDLKYKETLAIVSPGLKHELLNCQNEETIATVRSRVKLNEVKNLQHEETLANAKSRAATELKDATNKETLTTVKSLDKHEAKDLQHEETRVRSELKNSPNEETLATVKSRDKHGVKDILPKESMAKKRKINGGEMATSSFSVGPLLSNIKTSRNTDNVDVMPKRKVAQVPQIKASLIKTVNAPVSVKQSPVTNKKPVETKPSKPLTMEELYHVILKWDPTMLMKNFTPDIRNCGQVRLIYETMDDYYNVFKPLLFLECWAQALREWQNKSRHNFTCVVKTIKEFVNNFLLVICHQRVCTKSNCDEKRLRESDLMIVKMKDEKLRPLFAIVESVKQERSCWKPGDEGNSDMQYFDLRITLRLIPKERGLLVHETIRCDVVTSLVTTIRKWRGMMFFPRSLLARDMLQPRIDKCCNNKCHTGKTAGEQVYNKSQAAAIDGTLAALRLPFPIPRISFIQGPPGTGKSHTIIGLIKSYLKSREIDLKAEKGNRLPGSKVTVQHQALGKILLCAPSNAAVYVLLRRMIAEMKCQTDENGAVKSSKNCGSINLVCVGRTSILHPEVLPFALDTLAKVEVSKRSRNRLEQEKIAQQKVEATREKMEDLEKKGYQLRLAGFQDESEEVKRINTEINGMVKKKQRLEKDYLHIRGKRRMLKHEEEKIRKDVLLSADVICCTLNASGSALLHKLLKTASGQIPFGCIIVDEACQSCELDLLIPLQFGSSKLVMVGDPEQLRSTVLSKKAQELLLGQSMYERLYKVFKKRAHSSGRPLHTLEDNPIQLLDLQYRMHPEISLFPARYVYQGRVKDERSLTTRKSVSSLKPYALLNVRNGTEQSSPCGSLCNPMESELVVDICWMLKKEVSEDHFGIITPYRAQVNLAQKRLRQRGLQNVEVDTVDGFQGREKDVVIMSCVRANEGHRKSIGFLADRTRLNVALTRAKYSLIILLNVDSLQTNVDWRACIDDARQRGVLYDVSSAKHLSQIFLKNDTRETEHLSKSGASTATQHKLSRKDVLPSHTSVKNDNVSVADTSSSSRSVSSEKTLTADILPSHVSVKNDNVSVADTSSSSGSVSSEKTLTADILPSHASVKNDNASTADILPSHVSVKNDNASAAGTSSSSANMSSEKTCIPPPCASAQSDKASTADILPSHWSVPNINKSNEQISSSDEFDFDDHEPDIGSSHGNDEIPSDGQLCSKSADCNANKSLISGELVDLVVHCGESIQAQLNPYMQQLVQHERVDKLIRN